MLQDAESLCAGQAGWTCLLTEGGRRSRIKEEGFSWARSAQVRAAVSALPPPPAQPPKPLVLDFERKILEDLAAAGPPGSSGAAEVRACSAWAWGRGVHAHATGHAPHAGAMEGLCGCAAGRPPRLHFGAAAAAPQ